MSKVNVLTYLCCDNWSTQYPPTIPASTLPDIISVHSFSVTHYYAQTDRRTPQTLTTELNKDS